MEGIGKLHASPLSLPLKSYRMMDLLNLNPDLPQSQQHRLANYQSPPLGDSAAMHLIHTTAVQPVATCRQSPCRFAPTALVAPVLMTSFSSWRLAPTAIAAPVPIMTSFSLWRHSLLSWPRPPLLTYVRYGHFTKWHHDPSSRLATIDMGQKLSGAVPFFLGGVGSTSNTKSPGPRPTSVPSGILVRYGHFTAFINI